MTVFNMPDIGKTTPVTVQLLRQQRKSGLKGGVLQVVDDGPSFWSVQYEVSGYLSDADYQAYVAWIEGLRDGIHQFRAWVRKFPIAYPNGAYPSGFHGIGAVKDVNGAIVTLKDLPDGFTLLTGDVLTIEGDVDRLHRVFVGGVVVGGEVTLTLDPEPHVSVGEDDIVHFSSPFFTAQIQPGYDLGAPVLGKRQISFSALQRLKP